MIKKKDLNQENKKIWEDYIKNPGDIYDKDNLKFGNKNIKNRFKFDLHGFSLDDANKTINNFIEKCYSEGVDKINVITGKGSRSKNKDDPYQSEKLGILKYSIPDYIKGNNNLMKKIKEIDYNSIDNPNHGSFNIFLKKK